MEENRYKEVMRIRSENRRVNHPENKKRCNICLQLFDGIKENFHIRGYDKKNKVIYKNCCKLCDKKRLADLKIRKKKDKFSYFKTLVVAIKHRAKVIDVPFSLDALYLMDLWNKQNGKCFYTGDDMDFMAETVDRKSPHRVFPSVDRKNPKLGYINENVVICKWEVNRMKNDLTTNEFIDICKKVLKNHSN